jgi:hypothetical protein
VAAIAIAIALGTSTPRANAEPSAPVAHDEKAKVVASPPPSVAIDSGNQLLDGVEHEEKWHGLTSGCAYLAPKTDFPKANGDVDVVFHFHAGMMSEKELRESGLGAVFVSCGFGLGTGPYADYFADPNRFGQMTAALVRALEKQTGKPGLHIRKLGLVGWSAGFAAVGKILGVDRYYDMVDTVVLLDGFHSRYKDPNPKTPLQGKDHVELAPLKGFIAFAKDAMAGKKTMVLTHSSIITPDYPTAAEATGAMLDAIGVPTVANDEQNARGMTLYYTADAGSLHVRGFKGQGPRDHFAHLHLIGEVLRSWVVPRWKRQDPLVYTLAGEQR